jgi:putative Mg2+ transporter-C (MgtC) family protein
MFDAPWMWIAARLLLAGVVGALVGVNRELHDKPAGLRTHALVSMGAALMVMQAVPTDPAAPHSIDAMSRVLQGVLTGVGFLGAGVILRNPSDGRVHGLTTAAGIWITAMLGAACGAGRYVEVLLAFGFVLLVLVLGKPIERYMHRKPMRKDTSAAGSDCEPGKPE